MRNVLIWASLVLATIVTADPSPSPVPLSPFIDPTFSNAVLEGGNDTAPAAELLKRQSGCASGYSNCFGLGAPGLCCKPNTVCSADSAGNVGCCPVNAACTGRIAGATATGTASATGSSRPTITGTTTSTGSFFIATGTTSAASRSTVSNPYYPFPFIATTYTNAAACSAAYSGCQTDLASCTQALTGGIHGVTISAPNGGVTVQPVTTTLAPAAASSVCSSLSSTACYGLVVEACGNFGNGGATGVAGRVGPCLYGMGAGVAVGVAGQMLG